MSQPEKKHPKLLTLNHKQACELLNCHPNALRLWDAGYLVVVYFGIRRDRCYKR